MSFAPKPAPKFWADARRSIAAKTVGQISARPYKREAQMEWNPLERVVSDVGAIEQDNKGNRLIVLFRSLLK
jgi:hypothetical protein